MAYEWVGKGGEKGNGVSYALETLLAASINVTQGQDSLIAAEKLPRECFSSWPSKPRINVLRILYVEHEEARPTTLQWHITNYQLVLHPINYSFLIVFFHLLIILLIIAY